MIKESKNAPYSMSFSSGALYQSQSIVITGSYSKSSSWEDARAEVLEKNLLQTRTRSTANRVCKEVISRLRRLTPAQLGILITGNPPDQAHILWAAVCKRYRFINDFAVEAIHEKFLNMDFRLSHSDYDAFFNQKAEWHAEVARIRPSTYGKLRQVVFKMLREAELVSHDNMIVPVLLSPTVEKSISDDPDLSLSIFPYERGR